ncbi:MAG: hypothetical protein WBA07_17045 [Rivularia sp. (in: cyanobacteria)]
MKKLNAQILRCWWWQINLTSCIILNNRLRINSPREYTKSSKDD